LPGYSICLRSLSVLFWFPFLRRYNNLSRKESSCVNRDLISVVDFIFYSTQERLIFLPWPVLWCLCPLGLSVGVPKDVSLFWLPPPPRPPPFLGSLGSAYVSLKAKVSVWPVYLLIMPLRHLGWVDTFGLSLQARTTHWSFCLEQAPSGLLVRPKMGGRALHSYPTTPDSVTRQFD
jgi:hypothetical protein